VICLLIVSIDELISLLFSGQLFSYERLILILLHVVGDNVQDDFVRRIAIYLLNSLACQVDGKFKQLVGDLGAIEVRQSRCQAISLAKLEPVGHDCCFPFVTRSRRCSN